MSPYELGYKLAAAQNTSTYPGQSGTFLAEQPYQTGLAQSATPTQVSGISASAGSGLGGAASLTPKPAKLSPGKNFSPFSAVKDLNLER